MNSYNNTYQQQQQYASPINYYGFSCNYPESSSLNYLNNNYNSYSSSTNTWSSSYSQVNNTSIASPSQSNSAYSVSSLSKQYQSPVTTQLEFNSPKTYDYSSQSISSNYTPSISHYEPTNYSTTYTTSTPYQTKTSESIEQPIKQQQQSIKKSHKRPKVMKLNISQTNIGFGTVEFTPVLSSDLISTPNNISKSFKCTECTASFSIAAKLFMHQHKQHKNRSSTECPICYKKFNSPANALVHVRAHTQEKTYKCTECNLAFCDSSTLKKHIRTHTGEKPYECHLCNKSFAQSGNLKRHLAVHEKYDALQGLNTPKINNSSSLIHEQESTPSQTDIINEPYVNLYQNQTYEFQSNYPNQQLYSSSQSYY